MLCFVPNLQASKAGGEDEPHVLLVGVAETYRRSKVINVLRVDFDLQVLDKANKHIIKDTQGHSSFARSCVCGRVCVCVCGGLTGRTHAQRCLRTSRAN